jgi:hypothetical protein
MDFKALALLLDPVLGQNLELDLCIERMEVREMLLLGPSLFSLTLLSHLFTFTLRGGSLLCPKTGSRSGHKHANFQSNHTDGLLFPCFWCDVLSHPPPTSSAKCYPFLSPRAKPLQLLLAPVSPISSFHHLTLSQDI